MPPKLIALPVAYGFPDLNNADRPDQQKMNRRKKMFLDATGLTDESWFKVAWQMAFTLPVVEVPMASFLKGLAPKKISFPIYAWVYHQHLLIYPKGKSPKASMILGHPKRADFQLIQTGSCPMSED